jgi:hypothetical protein
MPAGLRVTNEIDAVAADSGHRVDLSLLAELVRAHRYAEMPVSAWPMASW